LSTASEINGKNWKFKEGLLIIQQGDPLETLPKPGYLKKRPFLLEKNKLGEIH
jgi:hypothetical protein